MSDTNAPARLKVGDADGWWVEWDDVNQTPPMEYVRADIADALLAALEAAERVLDFRASPNTPDINIVLSVVRAAIAAAREGGT